MPVLALVLVAGGGGDHRVQGVELGDDELTRAEGIVRTLLPIV